jgi:hypothetical protein
MRSALRVGLALALRRSGSGRRRAGMTAACLGIGALIVAVAFSLSASVGQVAACDTDDVVCAARVQVLAFGIFGLPGVVLIAAGARIGARARDRQLAGLRLLGVSGRTTTIITTTETVLLACGALVAALAVLGLVATIGGVDALHLTGGAAAATVAAVLLVAGGSALLAARTTAVDPGAVARERPQRRPSVRSLAPLALGVLLLLAVAVPGRTGDGTGSSPWWVAGLVLTAVGLPLAVPVLIRLLGRAMTGARARPVPRLVGRSLQFDARASGRLIATLTTMTVLAVIVQGLWADYVSGPLTAGALQAQTTGPNDVVVDLGTAQVRFPDPGEVDVLDAVPLRVANCVDGTCAGLLVATCPEYRRLVEDPDAWCDPDRAFTLGDRPDVPSHVGAVTWRGDPDAAPVPLDLDLVAGRAPVDQEPTGAQTRGDVLIQQISAVVPPAASPDLATREWVVSLRPGLEQHAALRDATGAVSVDGVSGGIDEYSTAIGYRTVMLGALIAAFAAGLSGVVLLGIDGAIERRRTAARLTRLGVPRRVITGTYLIAQIVPLAIGLPAAALLGALAYGVALYQPVAGLTPAPWVIAGQTSLVALVGAGAASVVISLGLAAPRRHPPTSRSSNLAI